MGIFSLKNALVACAVVAASALFARDVWTCEQANEWFAKQKYRAGVNYVPSYAINSIEFWQKESYNPKIIDSELALLESLGMNTVRVFLNDLVWKDDPEGFYKRLDNFLEIADKHGAGVMFVFFTNGGKDNGKLGKQDGPNGTHNSNWRKTPSYSVLGDKSKWGYLEEYVKGVVSRYANDKRVLVWDIYNEPGHIKSPHVKGGGANLSEEDVQRLRKMSLDFLEATAQWARSCNPSQPITYGTFVSDSTPHGKMFNNLIYSQSDVISYHSYGNIIRQISRLKEARKHNRPVMCTEWMARPTGSCFNPVLKFLKQNNVWSYSFGLVAGKIETWRPSFDLSCPELDSIWYHDIFKADHTPYEPTEVEYIKSVLKD